MFVVAALYQFKKLANIKDLQKALKDFTKNQNITGTLLLAKEGINGTVAGSRKAIDSLKSFLQNECLFLGLEYKESFFSKNPFYRIKVKIKKEIVTLGQPKARPSEICGTYVNANEWDKLICDPAVTVIDVRNDYEVAIGKFKNAIDPKTKTFREFPEFVAKNLDPKVHKKIAMSCTGGIRCEKASSYMKLAGFEEVYHLKGGVLKYLEDVPTEKSNWAGECFVFDQRVAVDHDLKKGSFDMCFGCRLPVSQEDKLSQDYLEGVHCPNCKDQRSEEQKQRAIQRQFQIKLSKSRGHLHLGQELNK